MIEKEEIPMGFRLMRLIFPAILLLALSVTSHARLIAPQTLESITQKATVLAVGEVIEVTPTGTPSREERNTYIQDVNAKIRILRTFPNDSRLVQGDIITVCYERYDPDKPNRIVNGYIFPELTAGDCFVFPLIKKTYGDEEQWRLIDREDINLLVPCVKKAFQGVEPENGIDFLINELAGNFMFGNYCEIYKASHYLGSYYDSSKPIKSVYELFSPHVKDEDRWAEIAVAVYNSIGLSPRPKVSEILNGQYDATKSIAWLVEKAASHIDKGQVNEIFIEKTIQNVSCVEFHDYLAMRTLL
jgi:hypothetical protein